MTWQNAFDMGVCTVTLRDWTGTANGAVVWSGVMRKGGQQTGVTGSGKDFTLAIGGDGSVSLSFATNNTFGDAYEVQVVPSYPHDFAARARSLATDALAVNVVKAVGEINASAPVVGVNTLDWTIVGTGTDVATFTPDPLDMSALTGTRDLIGAYVGTQAI